MAKIKAGPWDFVVLQELDVPVLRPWHAITSLMIVAAVVVVAAMGAPRFLGVDAVGEGAIVVDVGINRIDAPERPKGTRLVGDVDYQALLGRASAMTPVPGGVGPMTIAMLLENTWDAMEQMESDREGL